MDSAGHPDINAPQATVVFTAMQDQEAKHVNSQKMNSSTGLICAHSSDLRNKLYVRPLRIPTNSLQWFGEYAQLPWPWLQQPSKSLGELKQSDDRKVGIYD